MLFGNAILYPSSECLAQKDKQAEVAQETEEVERNIPSKGFSAEPTFSTRDATARWRIYTDRARDLVRQGKMFEAERFLKQALEDAKLGFGTDDPHMASACQNLAELYRLMHRYDEAFPLYEESLKILGKAYGTKDIRLAFALHNVAGLYLAQGKLEKASEFYEQSLRVKEASVGPGHTETANTKFHLAEVRWAQGKREEGIRLARAAVDVMEQQGMSDDACFRRRTRLGEMLFEDEKPAAAEPFLRRALSSISDHDTIRYIKASENLAIALKDQNDLLKKQEAREILSRVEKFRRQGVKNSGGLDQLALAMTLRRLAEVEHSIRKISKDSKQYECIQSSLSSVEGDHRDYSPRKVTGRASHLSVSESDGLHPFSIISEAAQIAENVYLHVLSSTEKGTEMNNGANVSNTDEITGSSTSTGSKVTELFKDIIMWWNGFVPANEVKKENLTALRRLKNRPVKTETALLEFASCLHMKGDIALDKGELSKSLECFQRALELLTQQWPSNSSGTEADNTQKQYDGNVQNGSEHRNERIATKFEALRKDAICSVCRSLKAAGQMANKQSIVQQGQEIYNKIGCCP